MEFTDAVAEGKAALTANPVNRVAQCLKVLPVLLAQLDRVVIYQTELRDVRLELTERVRSFRNAVWEAQRQHPEVTYKAAQVQAELKKLTELMDRLDRLLTNDR